MTKAVEKQHKLFTDRFLSQIANYLSDKVDQDVLFEIILHRPRPPRETAAWWVEYVCRWVSTIIVTMIAMIM